MQRVWVGLPAVCCGVSAARWRTVPPRVTTPFQVTYQICGEFRWVTSCMLWSECSRMVDCTATCHYSITGNVPNYAESAGGFTRCMLWSGVSAAGWRTVLPRVTTQSQITYQIMWRVLVGLLAVCSGVSAARWQTVLPCVTTPSQVTYKFAESAVCSGGVI